MIEPGLPGLDKPRRDRLRDEQRGAEIEVHHRAVVGSVTSRKRRWRAPPALLTRMSNGSAVVDEGADRREVGDIERHAFGGQTGLGHLR